MAKKSVEQQLFMLSLDVHELQTYMRESRITREIFCATPLNRASLCRLLAPIAERVTALSPDVRASLPGVDWALFSNLGNLMDERAPFQMDKTLQARVWRAASMGVPELWSCLANDTRVIRARAAAATTMQRRPDAWPQPVYDYEQVPVADDAHELIAALRQAASAYFEQHGAGPVLAAWLVAAPRTSSSEPVVVTLAHTAAMNDTVARSLQEALVKVVPEDVGRPLVLVSHSSLHPLLWDDMVQREALIWRKDKNEMPILYPVALYDVHTHGEGHGHSH